ncbi:stage III sporulation protein AE [Cuneatibacter caecimuris]|uniref:Stage III sporulation protein AE n=1 Tax=Cuneatibacter caecimuris TaxID=1796618 RepID=A0A4Q7PJI3_9FIRM|nr:stage III sporulation protein AE [Cuneatibacter caecimuris]RZT00851.1 stage III sporulation protein AE [Cuneatibacter caecimuris]
MPGWKNFITAAVCCLIFLFCPGQAVWAEESGENDPLSGYSFEEVQQVLEDSLDGDAVSFRELVQQMISGETGGTGDIWKKIWDALFSELNANQKVLFQVLLIGTVGAVFTSFSAAFGKGGVSQAAFYVAYIMMMTVLMAGFYTASQIVKNLLQNLVTFMQALVPTYFMAVAMTGQTVTSAAYYQITAVGISLVEWALLYFGLPAVRIYMVFGLAGQLAGEDGLSKLTELLKSALSWGMKTIAGAMFGLQIIQSILLPGIDSVKSGTVMKAIRAIPGIGNSVESVSSMVLGTGVLIKNGIGAAALVILLLISAVPVVKLLVLTLSYHLAAALVQPISDSRMTECISVAASAMGLLLKIVLTAVLLFFLTIAIVCVTTGGKVG